MYNLVKIESTHTKPNFFKKKIECNLFSKSNYQLRNTEENKLVKQLSGDLKNKKFHSYKTTTWGVEAGGSEAESHLWLQMCKARLAS